MNGQGIAGDLQVHSTAELEQLAERIMGRLGGRIRDLRLVPRGAGLALQGHSRTYYMKQLAQHLAMEESRLPIIANEIEVS
jgi:hypothetical protein